MNYHEGSFKLDFGPSLESNKELLFEKFFLHGRLAQICVWEKTGNFSTVNESERTESGSQ